MTKVRLFSVENDTLFCAKRRGLTLLTQKQGIILGVGKHIVKASFDLLARLVAGCGFFPDSRKIQALANLKSQSFTLYVSQAMLFCDSGNFDQYICTV